MLPVDLGSARIGVAVFEAVSAAFHSQVSRVMREWLEASRQIPVEKTFATTNEEGRTKQIQDKHSRAIRSHQFDVRRSTSATLVKNHGLEQDHRGTTLASLRSVAI